MTGMQALRNDGMAALRWESLSKIRVSIPFLWSGLWTLGRFFTTCWMLTSVHRSPIT